MSSDEKHGLRQTTVAIDATLEQDPEAFARIFQRFSPPLRLMINARLGRKLRRRVAAEDVIQLVFLEAFRGLSRFEDRGPGSFYAWLCYLARQRIIDAARHHGAAYKDVRREVSAEVGDGERGRILGRLALTVSTPSLGAGRRELQDRIAEAIRELPSAQRQVVRLYDLEGQTYQQIADQVGKSIGWVCGKRAEGLRILRGKLLDAHAA